MRIPANNDRTREAATWQTIRPGEPWAPWPTMPPFKSDEDRARESLPDGYRFVGRGSSEKPLFDKMRFDAIRWDDAKNNWQTTTLGTRGTYESAFYAVPEEPEPEPWSKPSDVPAEARWFIEDDGDCYMIQIVTIWGLILARDIRITWEELSGWRWSDRPFDRFKDGNPCTKGGDA